MNEIIAPNCSPCDVTLENQRVNEPGGAQYLGEGEVTNLEIEIHDRATRITTHRHQYHYNTDVCRVT
jgi:hypothetical protein